MPLTRLGLGAHPTALCPSGQCEDILVELEAENVLPATSSSATARCLAPLRLRGLCAIQCPMA
eukprot:4224905-Amphidinium_carterae.1